MCYVIPSFFYLFVHSVDLLITEEGKYIGAMRMFNGNPNCKWRQNKASLRKCSKPLNERKFTLGSARFPGWLNIGKQYILLVSSLFSFWQSEGRWRIKLLC